jgi:hypothetical protein
MVESSEITEKSLKSLCHQVLSEKVFPFIETFLSSATKNEIKGLKVVYSIQKHEGLKKFRPRPAQNDSVLSTVDQLKKKYLKSNYNSEFCKEQGPETGIFKYKKLSELKCSEVLSLKTLENIESWLMLKDDFYYQNLVLIFLRGIYSVFRSQEAFPTSSHRECYSWVKAAQVGKSQSPLKAPRKIREEKFQQKRSESYVESVVRTKKENFNESPKLRAVRGLKGNGEITSWISNVNSKNTSLYQDTYLPIFHKPNLSGKSDFHTSVVFRLLPSSID